MNHETSSSAVEAGQHPIRSLTAHVNRILNADLSDHSRKLQLSANLTAPRRKDGGYRSIAVGNVTRRLASKVGCAAVMPSLARQLSPTQIGVDIKGACEAAVHAICLCVVDHIESGQSHENWLIAKLDLKDTFDTDRRDHLLRVFSERASPIANLAHHACSSSYAVLSSGPTDLLCYWHPTSRSPWSRSPCDGSRRGGIITVIRNKHMVLGRCHIWLH